MYHTADLEDWEFVSVCLTRTRPSYVHFIATVSSGGVLSSLADRCRRKSRICECRWSVEAKPRADLSVPAVEVIAA